MSASVDFHEAVRLLAARADEQQLWLSNIGLASLPEELALQFDDLTRVPDIFPDDARAEVDALFSSIDRIPQPDWLNPDFLQSERWNEVRISAARLLALIQS
ncbi:MAG: hypothetical protein V4707_03850 [Pseudomonadota bacterium]